MKIHKPPSPDATLILDIELAPMRALLFNVWDVNVGIDQVTDEWYIMCFAAKWRGHPKSKVMYMSQQHVKPMSNDTAILETLKKLLDMANVVVTQNGKKFDVKKINTRIVTKRMQPPSSFQQIDTLVIAKRKFSFTWNSLKYLTHILDVKHKKKEHAEFSGINLWKECLAGNKKAWKVMKEYNIWDILGTEEVAEILNPWNASPVNYDLFNPDGKVYKCQCGGTHFIKNGFRYVKSGTYQKHTCKGCGAHHWSTKNGGMKPECG